MKDFAAVLAVARFRDRPLGSVPEAFFYDLGALTAHFAREEYFE
jgi:hypothetical protein